ncbi:hypothetical protein DSECCO2_488660 [anaerobic digester metagenome]
MLKRYFIDASALSYEEAELLESFLDGYASNIGIFLDNPKHYDVFLEEHQTLEGLPQIPSNCKITRLS